MALLLPVLMPSSPVRPVQHVVHDLAGVKDQARQQPAQLRHASEEAGAVIRQVVQDVKQVTDIVGEISSVSAEQSTGLGHVTQAVAQTEQATQQNAALVEQGEAASENLKHQAHRLNEVVQVFRLEERLALTS